MIIRQIAVDEQTPASAARRGAFAIVVAIVMALAPFTHADDSELVKAAKANGGPHSPSKKAITNDDVKKNATRSGGATSTEAPALSAPKNELERQAEQKKARAAAEQKVRDREAHVTTLEKELAAIEQSYYDATDLDLRDRVITRRFALARTRLESARGELAVARDEAKALLPANVLVRP